MSGSAVRGARELIPPKRPAVVLAGSRWACGTACHHASMPHVVEIPVHFGHIDQAKIVYYPHLYHFGHVAMEETFRDAIGISYPDLIAKERLGFPAVHMESDFLETVGYGERLRI